MKPLPLLREPAPPPPPITSWIARRRERSAVTAVRLMFELHVLPPTPPAPPLPPPPPPVFLIVASDVGVRAAAARVAGRAAAVSPPG